MPVHILYQLHVDILAHSLDQFVLIDVTALVGIQVYPFNDMIRFVRLRICWVMLANRACRSSLMFGVT